MIPLLKVFMPPDIEDSIGEVLHSGMLSYGSCLKEFEQKVRQFVGNEKFMATNSFNMAMLIALQLADVESDDEVLVSPMSCLATNQAINSMNAKIVWADIDPKTGTIDPTDLGRKITVKTKAIVHYHWAGYPGYIDEINKIAKENGIRVIEDASESFGSDYKEHKIGNNGTDMVCFSFETIRSPCTIDGGGITFNDNVLYKKSLLMRDYGIERIKFRDAIGEIDPNCDIEVKGYGAKLGNISGYIGCQQMNHLKGILEKQSDNGRMRDMILQKSKTCEPLKLRKEIKPNYWVYSSKSTNRDDLLTKLHEQGLCASKLHLRNDNYSIFHGSIESLPGVNDFSDTIICFPSGWWFNLKEESVQL